MALVIELDRAPHDGLITAITALPESVTQHDHLVLARLILIGREDPAQDRSRPQDLQAAGGHPQSADALRLSLAGEVQLPSVQEREVFEDTPVLFPVEESAGRSPIPLTRPGSLHTWTSCPGWSNGSGLSNTASTMLNTAVVAPMPRASVSTATAVKPGFFNNWRKANLRSFIRRVVSYEL